MSSIKVKIYNKEAEAIKDIKLSDSIFGVKLNKILIHQAMTAQLGNQRQVLAHTKDRSEIRGGGKKPWNQKGTGRARAGSSRSPIWIGGGITFGPRKDRNFKKDINKKMKQKAMFMVLSDRVATNNLILIDEIKLDEYKTKIFNKIINNFEKKVFKSEDKNKRSILVICGKKDEKIKRSGRNLQGIKIINSNNINILDLLKYKNVLFTVDAIEIIKKRYIK